MGSVHKSAQLIWAACPPYWHGWLYRHDLTKTCQNVGVLCEMSAPYAECRRPPTFLPFFQRKVKNLNPTLGIGETKLKAKFIGPFRVIKAYPSSLVVIPWTENPRLEEYYKDPDLFRYNHRGDIRPFHTRQVSVKDCKPYRAATTEQKVGLK